MESFHWGKHFITGLDEVDNQHHRLVDIINQFGNLLAENLLNFKDIETLYKQLTDYAVYHFEEEEKLMIEVNLDPRHVHDHIEAHQGFLGDVSTIYATITPDDLDRARSFLNFLTHWLAYHILGQDQDMAKQIEARQSGMSPSEAYDKLEQERLSSTQPLLEALNGLFGEVSQRNRELKQLNESLEEKVAIRTKELFKANQDLETLSLTDVLTNLPNRRHAIRLLTSYWKESSLNNTPLVGMMIDADHFKEVNDLYGHDAGDLVLIELAKTLQHSLRNDDVVCRLGGDEFFIICPNTDLEGGMHIAELTRKAVSEMRVPTGGEPWHGSICIGVACRSPDMKLYEDLIKMADKSVYAAKEAGKNCVRNVNSE